MHAPWSAACTCWRCFNWRCSSLDGAARRRYLLAPGGQTRRSREESLLLLALLRALWRLFYQDLQTGRWLGPR
jgi:hypothetical protein